MFAHEMIQNPNIPDPVAYTLRLAEYIASQRITIEVCLTSNAQTLPHMRDLSQHPLRQMLDHELSVSPPDFVPFECFPIFKYFSNVSPKKPPPPPPFFFCWGVCSLSPQKGKVIFFVYSSTC